MTAVIWKEQNLNEPSKCSMFPFFVFFFWGYTNDDINERYTDKAIKFRTSMIPSKVQVYQLLGYSASGGHICQWCNNKHRTNGRPSNLDNHSERNCMFTSKVIINIPFFKIDFTRLLYKSSWLTFRSYCLLQSRLTQTSRSIRISLFLNHCSRWIALFILIASDQSPQIKDQKLAVTS